jgi:hypothetical protein
VSKAVGSLDWEIPSATPGAPKRVPETCETIGFTDFSTTHFQYFTQLITGPNSIFSHVPDTVLPFACRPVARGTFYVLDTENVNCGGLCLRPRKVFPVGAQLHLVFGRLPELPQASADGIVR